MLLIPGVGVCSSDPMGAGGSAIGGLGLGTNAVGFDHLHADGPIGCILVCLEREDSPWIFYQNLRFVRG